MIKTFKVLIFLICLTSLNYPIIWVNGGPILFPYTQRDQIESLTIEAASNFLKSNAEVFLLLNEVEISQNGLNFDKALNFTNSALDKLEYTKRDLSDIIQIGKISGYDKEIVNRLKNFRYDTFVYDNKLVKDVFERLLPYFTTGDIIGFYQIMLNDLEEISIKLHSIKNQLEINSQPSLEEFWLLLQKNSETILLGNYATLVFNSL